MQDRQLCDLQNTFSSETAPTLVEAVGAEHQSCKSFFMLQSIFISVCYFSWTFVDNFWISTSNWFLVIYSTGLVHNISIVSFKLNFQFKWDSKYLTNSNALKKLVFGIFFWRMYSAKLVIQSLGHMTHYNFPHLNKVTSPAEYFLSLFE